jgi:hypothetical protein
MDTISVVCIGFVVAACIIIFFAVCLSICDHMQGPIDDYEEL